jgi:hypothetical protein
MAQTLCYLPGEKILDSVLWTHLRAWQKVQGLSVEKIRWTPDFLQSEQCSRDELAGALALLRSGDIQRVVYFEVRPRAEKDLDWLAFACTCFQLGIPMQSDSGEPLLSPEKAEALQQMFLKASVKPTPSPARTSPAKTKHVN